MPSIPLCPTSALLVAAAAGLSTASASTPPEPRPADHFNPPSQTMNAQSYTCTFTVSQSPEEVFACINQPRRWWSEAIEGDTARIGAVFYYHYRDIHRCTLKIAELTPGQRVVWRVLHNDFSFIHDKTEWNGTDIVFEIARQGDQTQLRFMHAGLFPSAECYGACSEGWQTYIAGSLRRLIATGQGQPNVGEALTGHERELSR